MFRARIILAVLVISGLLLSTTPAMAAPAATAGGPGCSLFYTVRHGDNLFRIALRYGTTYTYLMQLNGLANPNFIYAGQTLCVKAAKPIPFGFLYQVKRGDTLYSIATRFGWPVSVFAAVNHLHNPNVIYAGMILFIPYHHATEALDLNY